MFDPTGPLPNVSMETGFLFPALWHAARGLQMIPLDPFTNIPCAELLGSGYKVPEIGSSDPEQIREWWGRKPMCNPGAVQGAPSKRMVIDGDVKHGGDPLGELRKWQEETGIELQRGLVVRTPSGGWHISVRVEKDGDVGGDLRQVGSWALPRPIPRT